MITQYNTQYHSGRDFYSNTVSIQDSTISITVPIQDSTLDNTVAIDTRFHSYQYCANT